jgi:HprK-related kinase B
MEPKEITDGFRTAYPAEYRIYLDFGTCKIEVAANLKTIADGLADYFGDFVGNAGGSDIFITVHEAPPPEFPFQFTVKPPDPGKTKIKEEYVALSGFRIVRKRLTDMVFVFGHGEHLAAGPCLENMNQVVNFINNRYIEWKLCQGCLLGHAAAVIWKSKGLALAGFSGAGKSTLALELMNHGAVFVSNDRLMIKKTSSGNPPLFMYGVAKLPRINPGTILNNPNLIHLMSDEEQKQFSQLPKDKLWKLEHKYDAPIDKCFGQKRFILDAQMHGLVILNWKKDGSGDISVRQVNLSERKDLLPAFMKSAGLFFLPHNGCEMPAPTPENYIEFLSGCSVLEITGRADFEKAANACISFLENDVVPR